MKIGKYNRSWYCQAHFTVDYLQILQVSIYHKISNRKIYNNKDESFSSLKTMSCYGRKLFIFITFFI